jgi:hypothetical protein
VTSRDANQIAQEYQRRHPLHTSPGDDPAFPRGPFDPQAKPNTGTLTVWRDGSPGERASYEFEGVTVQVQPGLIIVFNEVSGVKTMLFSEPGWYADFVPDNAGE